MQYFTADLKLDAFYRKEKPNYSICVLGFSNF
jgi:hypothetical protein